ncbi:DMT family transporter [Mechercharimyces sp. CAU 1602]|uniref:DMT family transporter n=1 Tax=Mechercharimyces sp. CAU 1602 TaxID=2973933 RepID=UPI002161BBFA|nr:DMT family transporter [Mechercharimyces sp. CAU 1602]MCS1350717.1 DMT family transporter [Mechercharimyces sp. CAU 1602]
MSQENLLSVTPRQKWTAIIGLATVMAIFGSIGFVAAETGLHSRELVFIRCVFGAFFLGIAWVMTGEFKKERWNKSETIRVCIGGIILVLNWLFLFMSFEVMPVTITVAIYYLAPVFVLLLGSLIFRERLSLISVGSILLCFVGTLLIMGIDGGWSINRFMASGFAWALLAALFYSMLTLIGKGVTLLSPYAVSFCHMFLGVFFLIPVIKLDSFTQLSFHNWLAIVVIGSVHTGFVYYLFFGSIRFLPARITSALLFLDPAVAILLDMMITNFRPTAVQLVGILLTLIGIAFVLFMSTPVSKKEKDRDAMVDLE